MDVWDSMCRTIMSAGTRRGAMMGTLRCDHPDIEAFIDAKRASDTLRHFNLSVLVSEAFMQAVLGDEDWPLVFPDLEGTVQRVWSGGTHAVPCRVHRVVRARALWQRLCDSAYDCAEPGVLFIDEINSSNNLSYCEQLSATNPCGEAPLPAYGSCNLASINLTAFVKEPFTASAHLDQGGIAEVAAVAVRFLDNVIEIAKYPLPRQREAARQSRRIGIGITGLADALAMLGLRYDSEEARSAASHAMRVIRDAAYAASAELARERGAFPAFEPDAYLARPFIAELPDEIRRAIAAHGIRNSHLLAIAPAGSVSLLAHNVSTGIEPMFGIETLHRVASSEREYRNFQVTDYAYALWHQVRPAPQPKPAFFVEAENIAPRDHLLMQATLARYVDGSIAKTVTLPRNFPRKGVAELFGTAHVLGLKGCTIFRAGARVKPIERGREDLNAREEAAIEHGCTVGRASD
jgi:ribonucleoside-diphosphate reductase alpha chain